MPATSILKPGEERQSVTHALQPLFASSIAFLILNTFVVILRFFTVLKLRKPRLALTWDDWFLIPGYFCIVGIIACAFSIWHVEVNNVGEAHDIILKPDVLEPILKAIFALPILAVWAYFYTRMSILYLFLRIFPGKWARWATYFLVAFVTAQTIAFTIASIVICTPVSYFWQRGSAAGEAGLIEGSCLDLNHVYRAITPPNIVTDFLLVVLPLPEVWSLRTSRGRRIGLTVLFCTGLACLVSSAFRLRAYAVGTAAFIAPTLSNSLVVWLVIEPSIYLFAACLLAMHPLFRLAVPRSWLRNKAADTAAKSSDFARLMDVGDGSAAAARGAAVPGAPHTRTASMLRLQRKMSREDSEPSLDDRAAGAGSALEMEAVGKSDVPAETLREVTGGMGVLVTTEISVTKEERLERVLGF